MSSQLRQDTEQFENICRNNVTWTIVVLKFAQFHFLMSNSLSSLKKVRVCSSSSSSALLKGRKAIDLGLPEKLSIIETSAVVMIERYDYFKFLQRYIFTTDYISCGWEFGGMIWTN